MRVYVGGLSGDKGLKKRLKRILSRLIELYCSACKLQR